MSISHSRTPLLNAGATALMPDRVPTNPNVPTFFIAAILCFFMIEVVIPPLDFSPKNYLFNNRFYDATKTPYLAESVTQWQIYHALTMEEQVDVLILGDSSGLLGIDPKLIEKETNLSTWNMATLGYYATPGFTFMLDVFVRFRGTPRFAILELTETSLTRDNAPYRHWLRKLKNWLDPILVESTLKKSRTHWHNLPSYSYRNIAQNIIFNFSISNFSSHFEKTYFKEAPMVNDHIVNQRIMENKGYLVRYHADNVTKAPIHLNNHPDEGAIDGLESFLRIAQKNGITVLVIMTPYPENAKTLETLQTIGRVERTVATLVNKYSNSHFIPFEFFPRSNMASQHHLNEIGAVRQTRRIANWLREMEK